MSGGKIIVLAIASLVAIGSILLGLWAGGVLLSNTYGRGEQRKQINDARNRTFQYQHFFDLDAAIKSYGQQYANEVANPSGDKTYHASVLNGLFNQCAGAVNQYNADAQEFTRNKFLDAKLPVSESIQSCKGG